MPDPAHSLNTFCKSSRQVNEPACLILLQPDSPGFLRFYGQSGVMGTGSGPFKPLKVKHVLLTVGFAL